MKKIVFLGCENSHSKTFIDFIRNDSKYKDIEILGIYSHDEKSMHTLSEKYSIPIMRNYDDAVGKVDGIVVTARHGDNHYKYAKPYIHKGISMFIDKPITINQKEAIEFMQKCKDNCVKITGGSSLKFDPWISELKNDCEKEYDGNTLGGLIRCPISMENPNGGFFFYAQHLVESVLEIFGRYPKTVYAQKNDKTINVLFKYNGFDVYGIFVDGNYHYYASRISVTENKGSEFKIDENNPCFKKEWEEFYHLLSGAENKTDFNDFISPVFTMNAIVKSIESKNEELINYIEVK